MANVTTGKVRASYVHLFEPWSASPEGDKAYSLQILIPKTAEGRETLKRLRAAEQEAQEQGRQTKGKNWGRRKITSVIHDADDPNCCDSPADLEARPELAGHWYLSSKNTRKVPVVDRKRRPITDPEEVYSGCYVRVSLGSYPYEYMGKHGVGFGLNAVQFVEDGDRLGGGVSVDQAFDELDDEYDDEDLEDLI